MTDLWDERIFTYIHEWLMCMRNVGKHTVRPMNPMGKNTCFVDVAEALPRPAGKHLVVLEPANQKASH